MNLRIYYKYLSSRIASKWTVLLVDVIIVVISMLSACFLQYRLSSVSYEISLYVWLTIWAVLCNICFFHILRTYVGVIRFSSFVDIYRVFWSLTISYVVLFLGNCCWSVSGLGETLPNSILFMAYMFTFSLMLIRSRMKNKLRTCFFKYSLHTRTVSNICNQYTDLQILPMIRQFQLYIIQWGFPKMKENVRN
jgi:FlaA1/EpsC-like NDP-sugar epimerase